MWIAGDCKANQACGLKTRQKIRYEEITAHVHIRINLTLKCQMHNLISHADIYSSTTVCMYTYIYCIHNDNSDSTTSAITILQNKARLMHLKTTNVQKYLNALV